MSFGGVKGGEEDESALTGACQTPRSWVGVLLASWKKLALVLQQDLLSVAQGVFVVSPALDRH